MTDINEKLREAAKCGSEGGLKALLNAPGGDALSKSGRGNTALMGAARYGHGACLGLLLPASDALAKDSNGVTAGGHARAKRHASLGTLIDD